MISAACCIDTQESAIRDIEIFAGYIFDYSSSPGTSFDIDRVGAAVGEPGLFNAHIPDAAGGLAAGLYFIRFAKGSLTASAQISYPLVVGCSASLIMSFEMFPPASKNFDPISRY